MKTKKIYIDGDAGTTGLEIVARLQARTDLEVLKVDPNLRKDPVYKLSLAKQADLIILCLPDQAAIEAVKLYSDVNTKILDASSAHRIAEGWVYGMPELGFREDILKAQKVANPGCYPTGFLLAVTPLIRAGLMPTDYPVTVNAISGYSGGGRKMIESYEETTGDSLAVRLYGLGLDHKHLPEMERYSGLVHPPVFAPSVANFKQGMLVSIPLQTAKLGLSGERILQVWQKTYATEPFVSVVDEPSNLLDSSFLGATNVNGSNQVELCCFSRPGQALLVARLDNLGKGASGAAVQNLNLMLGLEERSGLS